MATISTFTKVGAKATTSAKLPKEVFEIEVKKKLAVLTGRNSFAAMLRA